MSDAPSCGNCRYSVSHFASCECHRHAPPAFSFLRFYELDLLRDIAWSLLTIAKREQPDKREAISTEATEAFQNAAWPDVEPSDWCGDFEPREAAA